LNLVADDLTSSSTA